VSDYVVKCVSMLLVYGFKISKLRFYMIHNHVVPVLILGRAT